MDIIKVLENTISALIVFSRTLMMSISAHPLLSAQDSLRANNQNDDENEQSRGILQFCWHHERREFDEQSDEEPSDECAVCRTKTAKSDSREHQEDQAASHLEPNLLVQPAEHASQCSECTSGDPDDPDDALRVDTG